jgi:hypothetical protein
MCLLAPAVFPGAATVGPCNTSLANFFTSDEGSTMIAAGCNVFPVTGPVQAVAAVAGALTIRPATGDGEEDFYFFNQPQQWGGGNGGW